MMWPISAEYDGGGMITLKQRKPPKMKKFPPLSMISTLLTIQFLSMKITVGDPRTQIVQLQCTDPLHQKPTNFAAAMDGVSQPLQASGFGAAVTGSGPNATFGLAQCYGDLSPVDCVMCYAEARTLLPVCPNKGVARVYLDGCFLRADRYSFYAESSGPGDRAVCGNFTREGPEFGGSVRSSVEQAVVAAWNGNGYARAEGRVGVSGNATVFVIANCWRTLNQSSCRACLDSASDLILGCMPRSEGRALKTGCFMRYSDWNFLNNVKSPNTSSQGTVILIWVAVISFLVALIVGGVVVSHLRKQRTIQKKRKAGLKDVEKLMRILIESGLNFKFSTLEKATRSFDEVNKLGRGGFGTVYKGVLADGREIAVKRLFFNNKQRAADFYNEVNIISRLEHKNLIRLLGCSCSGPESLIVYEFLPNLSVGHFIFDSGKGKMLNWEKRYKIILGTAEGLVYLHENTYVKIIHRDIKASNILLDSKFGAKIADFGLARPFQEDDGSRPSTTIAGTLGYMAPEYLAHGHLTEKADVYSFGVLVLEIVSGKPGNMTQMSPSSQTLVLHAWEQFQQGTEGELFDPNLLLGDDDKDEVKRVVHIGLLCTQESPSLRPTMSNVLKMVTEKGEDLPAPTSPPPFLHKQTMEYTCRIEYTA